MLVHIYGGAEWGSVPPQFSVPQNSTAPVPPHHYQVRPQLLLPITQTLIPTDKQEKQWQQNLLMSRLGHDFSCPSLGL